MPEDPARANPQDSNSWHTQILLIWEGIFFLACHYRDEADQES